MSETKSKLENRLKRLNAKKESLFRKAQTLHDMIPTLAEEKIRNSFLISARCLDRSNFESIVDEINELELEINPAYSPNYESLIAYDTLHGSVLIAIDKINLMSKPSAVYERKTEPINDPIYSNLPPIEIKPFTGSVIDWPRYRDLFTSIVANNPRLTQIQKLHYLVSTLSDQAAEIIKNFSLSESNFIPAWAALVERFESDRMLASNYFEELIKPTIVPAKPTLQNLQNYLSRLTVNVNGLKQMKINDLADFLFFSISIRQLDPVTRRSYESKNGPDTIPSFESLINFVKAECRLIEITSSVTMSNSTPSSSDLRKNENTNTRRTSYKPNHYSKVVLSTQSQLHSNIKPVVQPQKDDSLRSPEQCVKCGDDHKLYHCPKFSALNVADRRAFIISQSRCFNCFGTHRIKFCRSVRNCPICSSRHHKLLHGSNQVPFYQQQHNNCSPASTSANPPNLRKSTSNFTPPGPPQSVLQSSVSPPVLATSCSSKQVCSSTVILGTACGLIKNKQGRFIQFRFLIDCASSCTFITKNLVDKLGLSAQPCTQLFTGLNNTPVGSTSGYVDCVIKPLNANHHQLRVHAFLLNNILDNIPLADLPVTALQYVKGLQLADPEFYKSRPVDMLLGCDVLPKIFTANSVHPSSSEIGILSTIFGHIIIGSLTSDFSLPHSNVALLTQTSNLHARSDRNIEDEELNKTVARFWEIENLSRPPIADPTEEACEQHFLETHRRTKEGRYVVKMPFTCNPNSIDFFQSQDIATQRFYALESRFRKEKSLKDDCTKFLSQYKSLGHMVEATRPGKYFIPYFCIYNPNSPTTPARIVFDGSAKKSHISLNQILLPGPKLQHDIPDVLLNFRIEKLVFCCDISKMYRQILLDDEQRIFTHILFRSEPSLPLQEFELQTVTYGLAPSSYLAHRVLKQLIHDEGEKFPLACRPILEDSCVDDFFAGSDSVDGLLEIKTQLVNLLTAGGFSLNKWLSNSPEFLAVLKNSKSAESLVIRSSDDESVKVLGIGWHPTQDAFYFVIDSPPLRTSYTKRQVLSVVARIYDPLGFAAPMIFLFKCLLKDIWLAGVDWDTCIPPSLANRWNQCLAELPNLCQLRIPRCIFPHPPISCHVLGFCDGSIKGSAAAIFLRVQFSDNDIRVFFIKSKTRVAPSKVQTIPRLELIGAVLLAKLICSVKPFLSRIPIQNYSTLLFTDSTIVLSWIRKPPHLLKLFVSNRVVTILENSEISNWYHIPTQYNISDAASRGLPPQDFLEFREWFEGPSWSINPLETWPISQCTNEPLDLPEIKPSVLATCSYNPALPPPWLYNYSNFGKLQRIVCYILRFIHNSRFPQQRYHGPLSVTELKLSMYACIRCDQRYHFEQEIKNILNMRICPPKIQSLSPFIDTFNLIRVGGRLKNSRLSYDSKHPILLSNSSVLTRLIISHFHQLYLHVGPRTLQTLLANRFWIPNSRRTIRQVLFQCVRCARFRNSTASPPMGDLPAPRVTPSRPFLHCGVDLAGPYTLKESLRRNARTYKAYFALFICFAVKAVHIEILTSLSAECFVAALHRFTARRGLPTHMYSDQATNFKGASRQLGEITTFLRTTNDNPVLTAYFAHQGINFVFNVPRAPFMAGLAESNIKNVKYHLKRVIGHQTLTLEEFSTVTARIEAILNSRPLCTTSTSHDDYEPLTPGHFLIGCPLVSVPEADLDHLSLNRLSRWQLTAQISRSFWRRWEREYLQTLQNKGKWFHPSVNLSEGQLVWIKEDGSPPLSYPLGRIVKVHPGSDGVIRAVSLRTATGVYRRPVRKLAPLPIS